LNGLAYKDDSQIVTATVEKYYSDEPRLEVSIWET
jgi:Holliday junction resolvase RusA-like endonuclease